MATYPSATTYPGTVRATPPDLPNYQVLVAWEAVPANAFTLDGSQLDSSKVLTSQFSSALDVLQFGISTFDGTDTFGGEFSGLYTEVSDNVKSVQVRRGRNDNLDSFNAGEATIVLHDPTGKWNPLNASSPLYPYVVPGRSIVFRAYYNGQDEGVYRGFVRSIEHDPTKSVKETRLICQDVFLYLSRSKPTITALPSPTTTGTVIGSILTAVGWTEVALRSLATGDTINTAWSSNGTNDALSLITEVLETERGEFFHGRDGVVRYYDRFARYKRSSSATLTNVATGTLPATDITNVKNRATVTKTGSGSQTAVDGNSIANYGPSDYTPIESAYLNTPGQALSLAQWLVKQTANPTPPVRALEYNASQSEALMTNALSREIGDRITVTDSASGVASDFYIEGIEHDIRNGGTSHMVKFALTAVPAASPIMFDTSRVVNGEFSSPTISTGPYTTVGTSADIFAF